MRDKCDLFCRIEYVTKDVDNNIVLGVSKRTLLDNMIQMLKTYEGEEVKISIIPLVYNKEEEHVIMDIVEEV